MSNSQSFIIGLVLLIGTFIFVQTKNGKSGDDSSQKAELRASMQEWVRQTWHAPEAIIHDVGKVHHFAGAEYVQFRARSRHSPQNGQSFINGAAKIKGSKLVAAWQLSDFINQMAALRNELQYRDPAQLGAMDRAMNEIAGDVWVNVTNPQTVEELMAGER